MNITEAVATLEQAISDPKVGLPEEIFRLVSRLTPMVNVDLLIKDNKNRTLLAWRDDEFSGQGWHIPGGIVRFKESFEKRIQQVALTEVGTTVNYSLDPIAMNQLFCNHDTRGHFISFLHECSVNSDFLPNNINLTKTDPGFLEWHEHCPDDLIDVQKNYRQYI